MFITRKDMRIYLSSLAEFLSRHSGQQTTASWWSLMELSVSPGYSVKILLRLLLIEMFLVNELSVSVSQYSSKTNVEDNLNFGPVWRCGHLK
nr:Biomphalaria glabrata leucine-rich repeat and fibronectin type-III domain-containing protein 5-like [Biomphalaria glabrata]